MTSGEAHRLIRLKISIEKILDELQALKVEKDELDIETAHTRMLGSIVHDLYTGVERAFQKIALELDGGLPKGQRWHKDLLDHMVLDLKGIRPPVIDAGLRDRLDEYLRFRHIFRSVYGFQLKREGVIELVQAFDSILSDFRDAMRRFGAFLDELACGMG